jgi:hypothetical protein
VGIAALQLALIVCISEIVMLTQQASPAAL